MINSPVVEVVSNNSRAVQGTLHINHHWVPYARQCVRCDVTTPGIREAYACRTPSGVCFNLPECRFDVPCNASDLVVLQRIWRDWNNPLAVCLAAAKFPSVVDGSDDEKVPCVLIALDFSLVPTAPERLFAEAQEQFLLGSTVGEYPTDEVYVRDLSDMHWYWHDARRTYIRYDPSYYFVCSDAPNVQIFSVDCNKWCATMSKGSLVLFLQGRSDPVPVWDNATEAPAGYISPVCLYDSFNISTMTE